MRADDVVVVVVLSRFPAVAALFLDRLNHPRHVGSSVPLRRYLAGDIITLIRRPYRRRSSRGNDSLAERYITSTSRTMTAAINRRSLCSTALSVLYDYSFHSPPTRERLLSLSLSFRLGLPRLLDGDFPSCRECFCFVRGNLVSSVVPRSFLTSLSDAAMRAFVWTVDASVTGPRFLCLILLNEVVSRLFK